MTLILDDNNGLVMYYNVKCFYMTLEYNIITSECDIIINIAS